MKQKDVIVKLVQRDTLVDRVVKSFVDTASEGKFVVGERLPVQDDLSKMFGVSRNTMREALQRLESLGVVSIRHGDGTYLNAVNAVSGLNSMYPLLRMDSGDLSELIETRSILETQTAYLAALRAEETDIEILQSILSQMKQNRHDVKTYAALDAEFHQAIAHASHNSMLAKLVDIICDLMRAQQEEIAQLATLPEISYEAHAEIMKAIADGYSQKASELMKTHLENTAKKLNKN